MYTYRFSFESNRGYFATEVSNKKPIKQKSQIDKIIRKLEKQYRLKDVFMLNYYLVWVKRNNNGLQ